MNTLTEDGIRKKLKAACVEFGTQKAWAKEHSLSEAYVSDVLMGRRNAGKSILNALGYTKRFVKDKRNL